jgi:hypothetical protein
MKKVTERREVSLTFPHNAAEILRSMYSHPAPISLVHNVVAFLLNIGLTLEKTTDSSVPVRLHRECMPQCRTPLDI